MTQTVAPALPAKVNLTAYHGDSFQQTFRFLEDTVPVDLTGVTLTAQARGTDGTEHILPVNVIGAPTDGTLQLQLPAGDIMEPDLYDYDIELDDIGIVTTWVRGKLRVNPDVDQ